MKEMYLYGEGFMAKHGFTAMNLVCGTEQPLMSFLVRLDSYDLKLTFLNIQILKCTRLRYSQTDPKHTKAKVETSLTFD